jgi:hypothetical protein
MKILACILIILPLALALLLMALGGLKDYRSPACAGVDRKRLNETKALRRNYVFEAIQTNVKASVSQSPYEMSAEVDGKRLNETKALRRSHVFEAIQTNVKASVSQSLYETSKTLGLSARHGEQTNSTESETHLSSKGRRSRIKNGHELKSLVERLNLLNACVAEYLLMEDTAQAVEKAKAHLEALEYIGRMKTEINSPYSDGWECIKDKLYSFPLMPCWAARWNQKAIVDFADKAAALCGEIAHAKRELAGYGVDMDAHDVTDPTSYSYLNKVYLRDIKMHLQFVKEIKDIEKRLKPLDPQPDRFDVRGLSFSNTTRRLDDLIEDMTSIDNLRLEGKSPGNELSAAMGNNTEQMPLNKNELMLLKIVKKLKDELVNKYYAVTDELGSLAGIGRFPAPGDESLRSFYVAIHIYAPELEQLREKKGECEWKFNDLKKELGSHGEDTSIYDTKEVSIEAIVRKTEEMEQRLAKKDGCDPGHNSTAKSTVR